MSKTWRPSLALRLAVFCSAPLAACSGVDALTNHAALDVHTHMSKTVFLDPVPASAKPSMSACATRRITPRWTCARR